MNPHGREEGSMRSSEGVEPTLAYTPGGIKQTDLAAFIARSWAFAHFPPSTAPEGGSDVSPTGTVGALSSDLHERNGPRFMP